MNLPIHELFLKKKIFERLKKKIIIQKHAHLLLELLLVH